MNISGLNSRFKVLACLPSAEEADVVAIQTRFPNIPREYVELIRDATEIELDCDGKYIRIWGPKTSEEMDETYEISHRIRGCIPFGDDGGGRVIIYFNGGKGPGIYRVGYGDLDPDDAVWICESLYDLLGTGIGTRNL